MSFLLQPEAVGAPFSGFGAADFDLSHAAGELVPGSVSAGLHGHAYFEPRSGGAAVAGSGVSVLADHSTTHNPVHVVHLAVG